ncbi:MAG: type IV toxin-antitoxin system AbiEi family antitoxin [Bacteroidota bacterium]
MAEYISTESRRQLKQWQISYLDAGGNAFLKNKEVLVYVETGKNHAPPVHKNNRAFGKAGLKVIYQALLNPVILNQPYRQIGQRAMVTIDTVGKVIRALLEHKYLVKVDRRNYRLVRREQLFFEWVTLFNRVLRPKLKQRRYQLLVPSVNLSELPLAAESVWGGEVAAQQLGATLLPERVIIYTALPFTDIMQKWRLLPSEVGNITLFEALWRFDHDRADQPEKAPSPVLTYADLLYQATPRSLEAAEQIYQTHVQTNL